MKTLYILLTLTFFYSCPELFSQSSNEKQIEERIRYNTINNLNRYEGIDFYNFITVNSEKEIDSTTIKEQLSNKAPICNCTFYTKAIKCQDGNVCTINLITDNRISIEVLKDYFSSSLWTINEIWQEKRLK
jgi:hypothetical protein